MNEENNALPPDSGGLLPALEEIRQIALAAFQGLDGAEDESSALSSINNRAATALTKYRRALPPDSGGVREALQACWDELDKGRQNFPDQATGTWTLALAMIARRIKRLEGTALSRPSHCTERREEIERCAKVCRQIAINAERRAASHTDFEAKISAFDKMQAAQECEQSILALTEQNSGPTAGDARPGLSRACEIAHALSVGEMPKTVGVDAILNLIAALTPSPSAEPVAWRSRHGTNSWTYGSVKITDPDFICEPLYASPVSDGGREALAAALREISEGKGRYSRDRFEHACNCIEDMKQIARDALAALNNSFDKTRGGK